MQRGRCHFLDSANLVDVGWVRVEGLVLAIVILEGLLPIWVFYNIVPSTSSLASAMSSSESNSCSRRFATLGSRPSKLVSILTTSFMRS